MHHQYPVCRCSVRHGPHYHCPYNICTETMDARPERMSSHVRTHVPLAIDLLQFKLPLLPAFQPMNHEQSLPYDIMASFCIQGNTHEQRIRLCRCSSVSKPHRHCPFCTFICKNNPATLRTHIIKEHAITAPPAASPDTDILAAIPLNTPTSLWAVRSSNHGAIWITHVCQTDTVIQCDNSLCNQTDDDGLLIW